jgi:nucleoside-diphosphate-sugar epimerase
MRIALLGAGGFIGSHLVEHLLGRGEHDVVGIDLTDEKLRGIHGRNFTFIRADVGADGSALMDVIRRVDVVVDLVAYANPSIYVTSPLKVFELNFTQNLEVARLCIKYGKRLIQYSTAEVYGKAREGEAFSEDTSDLVLGPIHRQRWIYAAAKGLLERVLYAHGVAGDLDYTVVRPFNFVGPRIDYLVPANALGGPRVFPHFMSALLTGGPIRLVDGGRVHRTFMHILDANTAFQTLLDEPDGARNKIYNVGNPANNTTIRELATLMIEMYTELTGAMPKSEIVEIDGEAFYGHGYEDGDRLPPDISRMRSLGWSPSHDLRRTIGDAMAYYLVDRRVDARGSARRSATLLAALMSASSTSPVVASLFFS